MQAQWLEKKWLPWMGNRRFMATLGNHDFVSKYEVPRGFYFDQLVAVVGGITVWLSPWSNTFGGWAWMKSPDELAGHYNNIPRGTDIIVSHQPPYMLGDEVPARYLVGNRADEDAHVGSKELLHAIDTVKPKYVICGHIHNGRGVYVHGGTTILNVAVVNEQYQRVYEPVEFEI